MTPEIEAAPKLRTLVVDDTPDIRFLVRLSLQRDGRFEVIGEAADGVEAIRAAAEHQPDLVLLDLAMPLMDGLEALPEIRAQSPESKVVVLSGFNADQMSAQAIRLGASSYMEKGNLAHLLVPHILALFPERS
jgi:DNA-binding NarL/FixJ family response regulator